VLAAGRSGSREAPPEDVGGASTRGECSAPPIRVDGAACARAIPLVPTGHGSWVWPPALVLPFASEGPRLFENPEL